MRKWLYSDGAATMAKTKRYSINLFVDDDDNDRALWEWIQSLPRFRRQYDIKTALHRGIQHSNVPQVQQPEPYDDGDDLRML